MSISNRDRHCKSLFNNKLKHACITLAWALTLLLTQTASALSVASVLGSGGGDFDPWNTTRWAAWYSGSKLVKQFDIDCDVTLVDRGGSANPWKPDVSEHETGRIFYFDNAGRGKTFDGNGVFIDVRPDDPSLTQLYSSWRWYDLWDELFGLNNCFRISQGYSSSYGPTVIRNLWMKGFVQAIRTSFRSSGSYHPLVIDDCDFRRNEWGVYLSGSDATVQNCGIKQQLKGGMYCGAGSGRNYIINNAFQDNHIEQVGNYGDIAMDTAYETLIENNTHQLSEGGSYHCGVKFYHNMGEEDTYREHSPHDNILRGNTFNGYSVAYDIGGRMGRSDGYDLTGEGRDYVSYNLFENNTITNTDIGFKINCPGNTFRSNTFSNVDLPFVLHCVFYSLTENVINDQAGDNVYYWFVASDYSSYPSNWFTYQDDLNGNIAESDKFIHVRSDYGAPDYQSYSGPATVVTEDSMLISSVNRVSDISGDQFIDLQDISILSQQWMSSNCDIDNDFCNKTDINYDSDVDIDDLKQVADGWLLPNNMKDVYATGATPIDIAVGDYWVDIPGDEIAVIWDTPVSRLGSTDYYSIIMYDSNGIEFSRCGRSTTKWEAITAGNFVNLVGTYSVVEAGDEIAAVHSSAVSGYYPVYVFGRGRKDASVTLLTSNTTKIVDLTAGNFRTATDSNDEIAVIYTGGSSTINFCKPTETSWTLTTTGAANLTKIAAGNFDGQSSNGDEISGINSSSSLIYFYRFGASTHYLTAGTSGQAVWSNIAAGNFYTANSHYEVAVSSSAASLGIYEISYYSVGASSPFKQSTHDVLGVPVKALAAGKPIIHSLPSLYERADGFYSTDYAVEVSTWGDFLAVLPAAAQTTGTPIFWLANYTYNDALNYLKVTSIMR